MEYRKEIDGLRALAVVPVVLYHAGFDSFSGGFVGVDIFFVISGYLITSIILGELEKGSFSITNFYERRARRILPSLFFVITCCVPFAWALFSPKELLDFGESLIATSVFSSNILFWFESGYFEKAAEYKPLLHTWSLAVEEQFYLFFPLVLMAFWAKGVRFLAALICGLLCASLAYAQYSSVHYPSANFYLLPTRIWELLVGAIPALYLNANKNHFRGLKRYWSEFFSWVGLGLIVYSIFNLTSDTPYPSLWTLIPTVGSALVILYANGTNSVGRLLSLKVLVAIGLVSYSFYLWHQPILVFDKFLRADSFDYLRQSALVLVALTLAWFSWYFIEKPFRDRRRVSRRSIFIYALTGTSIVTLVGCFLLFSDGASYRLSGKKKEFLAYFENSVPEWQYFSSQGTLTKNRFECDALNIPDYRAGKATQIPRKLADSCTTRDPNKAKSVLLWGDSHAQVLSHGLTEYLPKDWQLLQVASTQCLPKIQRSNSANDYCKRSNWMFWQTLINAKPDVVVISYQYGHNIKHMEIFANEIRKHHVKKVVFAGPAPLWKPNLPKLVLKNAEHSAHDVRYIKSDARAVKADRQLKADFPTREDMAYVSLIDTFCLPKSHKCLSFLGADRKEGITSYDNGHLTLIASSYLAEKALVNAVLLDSSDAGR